VLREALVAARDVPDWPTSMMDGFAVHAGTPARLHIVEASAAGHPSLRTLHRSEAAPISTGALLPPGANAVVRIEDARIEGEVVVTPAIEPSRFVRAAGSDLRAGEQLLQPGRVLDGASIALLAGEGRGDVQVACSPLVAILATGSELRPPGASLAPGLVYDANGPALEVLVRAAGGVVRSLGIVSDDRAATTAAVRDAAREHSLVLISGGVSVGEHDHVRAAIEDAGGQILLWQVAMKPGKPLMLARIGDTPVVGLPGNPVSAHVGFWLFVRAMIRALMGALPADDLPRVEVALAAPVSLSTDRATYLRARVEARGATLVANVAPRQASSTVMSLLEANALVRFEPGKHELAAGALRPAILYARL
jgi:molybdopterin molybdotransferase